MLRTLTLKSQMKFGKFADYTVAQMLQIEKETYLCWVYYNSSNISFVPEILELLGIEYIIQKPGTDKEFWNGNKGNFNKPAEKKELTIPQAVFYKKRGEQTKLSKRIQHDKLTRESKAGLMNKNRNKL